MSLFEAVMAGDLARVEAALAAGADPNPYDAERRTPLMLAAERGEQDMVRALLAAGADPTLTDRLDESALTKAAAYGQRALVTMLYPHSPPEQQEMARALLDVGPDFFAAAARPPAEPREGEGLRRKLARAGAYLSEKLGDDVPSQRLERLERAEKNLKKR